MGALDRTLRRMFLRILSSDAWITWLTSHLSCRPATYKPDYECDKSNREEETGDAHRIENKYRKLAELAHAIGGVNRFCRQNRDEGKRKQEKGRPRRPPLSCLVPNPFAAFCSHVEGHFALGAPVDGSFLAFAHLEAIVEIGVSTRCGPERRTPMDPVVLV